MTDEPTPPTDHMSAIASLTEPTRRAVFEFVIDSGDWVSRDQTADAVGLTRVTAAHHLDRLAADGLLDIDFKRLSGRRGPGAGRPSKLYRRTRADFSVSVPPRDYELAGSILAEAVDRSRTADLDITSAVAEVAHDVGRRFADEIRARLAQVAGRGTKRRRRAVLAVLEDHGYEPLPAVDGSIMLRNCPFHHLAKQHTDLICTMNLCLLEAAVHDVGETGFDVVLEPHETMCCVRLRTSPR